MVTGSSAGAWAGFERWFEIWTSRSTWGIQAGWGCTDQWGTLPLHSDLQVEEAVLCQESKGVLLPMHPCKFFSLSMHLWKDVFIARTPLKAVFIAHAPMPSLTLLSLPFLSYWLFPFQQRQTCPSHSALNISVLASSSWVKTPERTLLLTPLQMSGAVPGECRCTARVRLIRELDTQGRACVAWLRASRKYRNKTKNFLASSLIKVKWIVPQSLFSLFSFPCFPPLLPHSCADCESVRFPPPTHKRLFSVPWEYLIFGVCAVLFSSECCQVTWWTVSQDYLMSLQSPHFQSPVIM